MLSTITASVGAAGGVNRSYDVGTVQRLLNQVPPLQPDSKCGPKTIAAIQKFQIQQFGWSGADGRVDPNGQTLRRLNDFDIPFLTTASILMCPHGASVNAALTGVGISTARLPRPESSRFTSTTSSRCSAAPTFSSSRRPAFWLDGSRCPRASFSTCESSGRPSRPHRFRRGPSIS